VDAAPFVLLPLGDGRFELRTFSDDSPDPIVLVLDQQDGRALGEALEHVLSVPYAPGAAVPITHLTVAGRSVTVARTPDGVQVTVGR
jgi:hypothetical protein